MQLYPHQVEGWTWLWNNERGILDWSPGTGKTYAALRACQHYPVLIVCPAYLLWNWEEAIRAMWRDHTINVVYGTALQKRRIAAQYADFTVISYNFLAERHKEIMSQHWKHVVFDEAHYLRGRSSQRTKAAMLLKSDSLYLLTGSLIKKDGGDVFPLLRLCNPKAFPSYWRYVDEYFYTTETPWAKVIGKARDPARFQALLAPYTNRQTLEGVFPDIPDAVWTKVPTMLTATEVKQHKAIKKEYRAPDGTPLSGAGAVVPELRRLTAASKNKIDATRAILADHEDEKVIVWVWYHESAAVVEECCIPSDRPSFVATGAQLPKKRAEIVKEWLATTDGVLIATIAGMGEGHNLQGSKIAIFSELSYIPDDNTQAVARQRRHGQSETVRAYAIVADKSVDDAIYKVAQRRDVQNSEARGIDAVLAELMKGE